KFQSGELDHLIMRGEDYAVLEPEQEKKGFKIYKSGATFGSQFLTFCWSHKDPIKRKWFNNKHFRKAVAYAIDRESYINNVLYGFGVEQWSPVSPAVKTFYNNNVIKYPYDLEMAREELKKGGFELKNDKLYDADGNLVKFEILTNSGNKPREALGTMLQEDLSKLGMEVKFSPIDFNALVKRLLAKPKGDWDAVIIGLTGGVEPNSGKNVWNSDGGLHFFNYDPENRKCWEKQVDMLFDIGAQILNTRDRRVVYNKWQYIVSDELPFLYTALPVRLEAFKNYVKGIKPSSYGELGGLWNIEEIWLDK
ncbi:MAG TPA: ABC transporter substrate-binding protein, partial [Candidatus Atribacteria bacterium]|nr:ABC transporter substrate-binding protein [Candidatus Atribacteria bacterium]